MAARIKEVWSSRLFSWFYFVISTLCEDAVMQCQRFAQKLHCFVIIIENTQYVPKM